MIGKIINEPAKEAYIDLVQRPTMDRGNLEHLITEIYEAVRMDGDDALRRLTDRYDGQHLDRIQVTESEIEASILKMDPELKSAILTAYDNISMFHEAQKSSDIKIETSAGVICEQVAVPIDRVGLYIPGGTAPLFSTVLMLAIPASIAGCKEILICSPPSKSGDIDPTIVYAAALCGVEKIYAVGGAQAVAAMAIGTESIPKVDKIFGPGNQYVTAAKSYARLHGVAMDMPAGPSELLVYADDTAIAEYVAADLLSQAEHGVDSQVVLVATSLSFVKLVSKELYIQSSQLPRKAIINESLRSSLGIAIQDPNNAFSFINRYAPEHLIIASSNAEKYRSYIRNAGSVFLGNHSPESAGDYASGTNHTLPTAGWARSYSGVNLDSFLKKITFQSISEEGIHALGPAIIAMAEAEDLQAHANAVRMRTNQIKTNLG